jgi:hypothetical protein
VPPTASDAVPPTAPAAVPPTASDAVPPTASDAVPPTAPAAVPPTASDAVPPTAPASSSPPRRARQRSVLGTGWLTVDSHPYGVVFVDGKRAGLTPLVRAPVAAGPHRVSVKLADGRVRHMRVVVEAGREAPRRRVDW